MRPINPGVASKRLLGRKYVKCKVIFSKKTLPAVPAVIVLVAVGLAYSLSQQAMAQTPNLSPGLVFRDCVNCPEMVVVPSGFFMMGSSPEEVARDTQQAPAADVSTISQVMLEEQPLHEVTIKAPLAVGRFPVTKAEYAAFVQDTGYSSAPGCTLYALQYRLSPQADWRSPGFGQLDREPVVCVSWQDAKAYIAWLNQKVAGSGNSADNEPYRLPSEAEWEYAARAGTRTARWWGDSIGRQNADCARCGSDWDQRKTAPVGSFHPSPFGLYDMLGNVSQWNEDCWNKNYLGAPNDGSASMQGDCMRRVARGGNWSSFPWVIRSATRSGLTSKSYDLVGFRVAKTLLSQRDAVKSDPPN